jgi:hypothetical protein
MPERLDDEELADWRTGRDAGLSARRAGIIVTNARGGITSVPAV